MNPPDIDSETGAGGNFWGPREYSHTVKRLENANKLCSELAAMIQERSEIEKAYAANLNKFASRVDILLKTGLEYGTCSNLLSGLAREAEDNAVLHNSIATSLIDPVQAAIKCWQKDNFHKSSISSSIKEVKLLESEFDAAQKLWYKNYKNVNRCKKDYFQACRAVRSQQVQVQNARNEPCGTPEQREQQIKEIDQKRLRKMEDKLKKATKEEEKTRIAYNQALASLKDVTPRYVEEMTQVFSKAQGLEKNRILFFKDQALRLHDVLDVSTKPNLAKIFVDFKATIGMVEVEADLKKWSLTHGVDMTAKFPTFEEYNPEVSQLGGHKNRKKYSVMSDANSRVTLSGMTTIRSSGQTTTGGGTNALQQNQQTSNDSTPAHGYGHEGDASAENPKLENGEAKSHDEAEASVQNHQVVDGDAESCLSTSSEPKSQAWHFRALIQSLLVRVRSYKVRDHHSKSQDMAIPSTPLDQPANAEATNNTNSAEQNSLTADCTATTLPSAVDQATEDDETECALSDIDHLVVAEGEDMTEVKVVKAHTTSATNGTKPEEPIMEVTKSERMRNPSSIFEENGEDEKRVVTNLRREQQSGDEKAGNESSMNGGGVSEIPPEVPPYLDLVDDGRPGVTIRALYDYTGVEADELTFVVGDIFEKLEDEDEQGWCKGRKEGRVGLYPANYVEAV